MNHKNIFKSEYPFFNRFQTHNFQSKNLEIGEYFDAVNVKIVNGQLVVPNDFLKEVWKKLYDELIVEYDLCPFNESFTVVIDELDLTRPNLDGTYPIFLNEIKVCIDGQAHNHTFACKTTIVLKVNNDAPFTQYESNRLYCAMSDIYPDDKTRRLETMQEFMSREYPEEEYIECDDDYADNFDHYDLEGYDYGN